MLSVSLWYPMPGDNLSIRSSGLVWYMQRQYNQNYWMRACLLPCCQQMTILLVLSKLLLKSLTASFLPSYLPPHPSYYPISTQYDFYLAYKGNKSLAFQESPTEVIKGIWNSRCNQNISRTLQCTVCVLQSLGQ